MNQTDLNQRHAYDNFDVQISPVESGAGDQSSLTALYETVARDAAGRAVRALFRVPFSAAETDDFFRRLRGRAGGASSLVPDLAEAQIVGGCLFAALFHGPVLEAARTGLDAARARGARLRVRVQIQDAPDLERLPWEFLYHPGLSRFAVLQADTTLVRHRAPALPVPAALPLAFTPPLRVVAVVAALNGSERAAAGGPHPEREWLLLQNALAPLEQDGLVALERLSSPTASDLAGRLAGDACHVLHFLGHGATTAPNGEPGLLLHGGEPADTQRSLLTAARLAGMLRGAKTRLVVLPPDLCAAPQNAHRDTALPWFAASARDLLRADAGAATGPAAVMTTRFVLAEKMAMSLARDLYAILAESGSLDAALSHARRALYALSASDLDWGAPLVYVGAGAPADGRLFRPAGDEPALPFATFAIASATANPTASTPGAQDAPATAARGVPHPLEEPEGAMAVDSPFYVVRSSDNEVAKTLLQDGDPLTIKGPRQVGKSSLLVRTLNRARQAGKRVGFLDFQQFDRATLQDRDWFFRQFCSHVSAAVTEVAEVTVEDQTEGFFTNSPLGPVQNCTRYFSKHVLPRVGGPLLLVMDEVDLLAGAPFRVEFFGMLRNWYTERAVSPVWHQLDMVLVTSTEPYLLIADADQSPFNVGKSVEMDDFSPEQAVWLNERHGNPLAPADLERLFTLVGGHPYLVRKALFEVASGRRSAANLFAQAANDESGPFAAHLSNLLFRLAEQDQSVTALRQVLQNGAAPNEDDYARLRGAGLVRRLPDKRVTLRCALYARYLGEQLQDEA